MKAKTLLPVLGMIVTTVMAAGAAQAQTPSVDERSAFRFEFSPTQTPRGLGIEGWAYNDSAWRLTNVRLRVECVDAGGTVTASAAGWVQGDLRAGGRAYFYVSVPSHAPAYRVTVESFHKISREGPPEAP